MISSILKWVQCFSIYFSVIALKEPQRAPDLLSYMSLIIKAHLKYSGDAWQGYDQSFKQRVAMTTKMQWATTDPTLWNLAGHANATRCKHCFSLYHSHNSCDWAPEPATASFKHQPTPQPLLTSTCSATIYALHGTMLHPLIAHSLATNMNVSAVFVQKYQLLPI